MARTKIKNQAGQDRHSEQEKLETPGVLQRFGLFFFKRRETTLLFWAAFVIFGITCYTTLMQRQGFPNVDVPVSIISGTYFVNDKQKVDADVALPASRIVTALPEVKSVSTQAGDNFFAMTVQYKDGTSSADGNALVSSALNSAKVIPAAARVEFRAIDAGRFAEQSDLLLSVSSRNPLSAEQLQERSQAVAAELRDLDSVQKVTPLKQVEEGINPATGLTVRQQRSFDRIGYRDASGAVVFYNSAIIGLQAKPSADALKLYDGVLNKIDLLRHDDAFSDLDIRVSADFAEGIRSQISNLQKSLLEGLLVVIIVSCLLISWRAGLATALSMATVLLMTIAALYASNTSLNTITLFALILSLGLIVDDTTIMVEAIDAANGKGADKRAIVAQAIKRVARASVSGTLVTMLAFSPMIFIGGILGSFIRILPISIIVALAMSLLVSLSLVPFFARFLLHEQQKKSRNPVLRAEKWAASTLADHVRSGAASRKKRWLYGASALLFSLLLFLGSLPYFSKLKFDIFPSTKDSDELSVALQFPNGETISKAQAAADDADIVIGDTLGKYMRRLTYQGSGDATSATAHIQLVPYDERDVTAPELVTNLQAAFNGFTGARVKVSQVDAGPPKDDYPFSVRIYEADPVKAAALAADIKNFLQNSEIKRPNGSTAKVTRTQISNDTFLRRNQNRLYTDVSAGFDATDTSALVEPAKKAVQEHYSEATLAPFGIQKNAVDYDFGNEANNQDSFKSMLYAFPILLAVMYILLLLQFKSFLQPLLIFLAIPFSFFGVAAGLYYTDNPLSFFVLVGFFALIGIAVNNTILLTDFANQSRDTGASKYEAVAQAVAARFRPLVTTSLTSVVALIPLALSDPFWQSLAVTLIFGLLSSTLLVVVAFPYFYLATDWFREFGTRWWRRKLKRGPQRLFDMLFFPVRMIRFLLWIIFSWPK